MSFIYREFMKMHSPHLVVQSSINPISVKTIGNFVHTCTKFVSMNIYLSNIFNGVNRVTHLRRDFHIVENLETNMLLSMDIIGPERISTKLLKCTASIENCKCLQILLSVIVKTDGKIKL